MSEEGKDGGRARREETNAQLFLIMQVTNKQM